MHYHCQDCEYGVFSKFIIFRETSSVHTEVSITKNDPMNGSRIVNTLMSPSKIVHRYLTLFYEEEKEATQYGHNRCDGRNTAVIGVPPGQCTQN